MPSGLAIGQGIGVGADRFASNFIASMQAVQNLKLQREKFNIDKKMSDLQMKKLEFDTDPVQLEQIKKKNSLEMKSMETLLALNEHKAKTAMQTTKQKLDAFQERYMGIQKLVAQDPSLAGRIEFDAEGTPTLKAGGEWKPQTKEEATEFERVKSGLKPPTAGQETTALYASRIKQANDVFESIENFINKQGAVGYVQAGMPSFLQGENMQSYQQAQRNFLNAVLRRESGAVISPSEFKEGRQQYFPQPGDKEAVLAQKKANRDLVMKNFIKSAGTAYVPYEETDQKKGATNDQDGDTKIQSFETEAEVESANLADGTPVLVGGKKFIWKAS